jgi:adenylate kinase family enzyme
MRRVLVIGSGGAGKSTFARELSRLTGLPLVQLDELYWSAGWIAPAKDEWSRTVDTLVAADRWVMDGNYGGTLEQRLAACDTVVFLDLPRLVCLARVLWRRIQYHGRARPGVAAGCVEHLSLEFLSWIWTYPSRRRPQILAKFAHLRSDQRALVLTSQREVAEFLHALSHVGR